MCDFSGQRRGFTLLEILVVVTLIVILAAILLPTIVKAKAKAKRVQCLNNLKQAGIAFHGFAHDHGDKFPMQVSTNNGGSVEFVQAANLIGGNFYFGYRHWQALSNELGETRVLVCPSDSRTAAESFLALKNENISYFVGVTADYSKPDSILAGDRNVTHPDLGAGPIVRTGPNDLIEWTGEIHQYQGNVLFADAHVELLNNAALLAAVSHSPVAQNALFIPVQPASTPSSFGSPASGNSSSSSSSGSDGNNGANSSSGGGGSGAPTVSANASNSPVMRLEQAFTKQPVAPQPVTVSLRSRMTNGAVAAPENGFGALAMLTNASSSNAANSLGNSATNKPEVSILAQEELSQVAAKLPKSLRSKSGYLFLIVLVTLILLLLSETFRRWRSRRKRQV